jgi:hypothetical protein
MRANYQIVNIFDEKKIIYIRDLCETFCCMSVTNDAENVIAKIFSDYPQLIEYRVFYVDTEGRVDELQHERERFTGFKFGYASEQDFLLDNGTF